MISVYLVDDHELVRTGIRRILEDERGIKVVGEAPDGETAVQWSRHNEADVILMDMKKSAFLRQHHSRAINLLIHPVILFYF